MEIDASDFLLGVVLLQIRIEERLHPVAYHSRKFSATKINYKICDKELIAIVDSFQEWRYLLQCSTYRAIVYTYYKNLEYFMSTCFLKYCGAPWNMSLSQFDFRITYQPRKQQGLLGALFWHLYLDPKERKATFN